MRKLYKYQRFSEFSLSAIINGYSWYSHASEFNDPFDTQIIQSDLLQKINFDREYILCLSALNDDLLMWAHYGDSHKGFCLEYTEYTDQEIEELKSKKIYPPDAHKEKIGITSAKPVEYYTTEKIHEFIEDVPLDGRALKKIFSSNDEERKKYIENKIHQSSFIKHINWKYEQEHRIVTTAGRNIAHPPGRISAVYFGMKMSGINKRAVGMVLSQATGKNCEFYQMDREQGKYNLFSRSFDFKEDMNDFGALVWNDGEAKLSS